MHSQIALPIVIAAVLILAGNSCPPYGSSRAEAWDPSRILALEPSNASYRPRSCDKIMRGKIILICRKVVSYDFTLHDFVTVYFQKENCCYQREAGRFSNELLRL